MLTNAARYSIGRVADRAALDLPSFDGQKIVWFSVTALCQAIPLDASSSSSLISLQVLEGP